MVAVTNLWQAFERQVELRPDQVAVTDLAYGGLGREQASSLTYRQLHDWAVQYSQQLRGSARPGDAALLLYASGAEFIAAFLGCLRAGVVAVLSPPPRRPYDRVAERLGAIVADADVRVASATAEVSHAELAAGSARLAELTWLDASRPPSPADDAPAVEAADAPAAIDGDSIAYYQYTSGSTSVPKGVMVTHANLLEQVRTLGSRLGHDADSVMVSWLPFFHDMGLIYTLVAPLVQGFPAVYLTPEAFVAQPARWLEAISRYRGTHSMAPNFGYDLCVRKVSSAQRADLDLSSWRVAANASEPIRARTIDDFAAVYEPYGLPVGAHRPCYGLAEATLIVTGTTVDRPATSLRVERSSLDGGTVRSTAADGWDVVSCGPVLDGFEVLVVNPETRRQLPADAVGEIWVAGPSVTKGYYRNSRATSTTFEATVEGGGPQAYLRTGDLGFLGNGELHVTGRLKDIIIVRGQNYFPQDIEDVAETADPGLRPGRGAAFSVDREDERVGIAFEVREDVPDDRLRGIAAGLRRAVVETFGITVDVVAFMPKDTIPKTSSGKLRRSECRRRLEEGTLKVRQVFDDLDRNRPNGGDEEAFEPEPEPWMPVSLLLPTVRGIAADQLGCKAADLDDDTPLAAYGLDSARSHELAGRLAQLAARPVPPTLIFDNSTLSGLVSALAHLRQERP